MKPSWRYLCCYSTRSDAALISRLLTAHGMKATFQPGERTYGDWYEEAVAGTPVSWCIYVNSTDEPRAREFKRGFMAALKIRGEPGGFADGLVAALRMLQRKQKPKAFGVKPILTLKAGKDAAH